LAFESSILQKTRTIRPTLSAANPLLIDSSFWQYELLGGYSRGLFSGRRQTTLGSLVNARAAVAYTLA